jgi:hypothetical protein
MLRCLTHTWSSVCGSAPGEALNLLKSPVRRVSALGGAIRLRVLAGWASEVLAREFVLSTLTSLSLQ